MNLTIREGTVADALLLADISRQTFYDTFAADNTPEDMDLFLNEQFTRGRLMLEPGRPELTFLIACDRKKTAGYVKLREGPAPSVLAGRNTLEIARLYAVKEYIGSGVGKLLMQASLTLAKDRKKEAVWLGVWERNQRAIDFYHRWGFEKFDEQDFLLGTDLQRDWLMKKEM
ncbi:MAG: family N-acetyltransferase [Flaviaesturariibacter sp.]|nr:family N-acetyltransferase [Flaviaesturariibacter sp.]